MSDPDARDPVDEAFLRAETVLGDEEDRAARRARVLAAVAAEAQGASRPAERSRGFRPGWASAAAAAVVVASVAVAVNLPRPGPVQSPSPSTAEPPATSAPLGTAAPPPVASDAMVASAPSVRAIPSAKKAPASGPHDALGSEAAAVAPPASPPIAEKAAPAAAPPPPVSMSPDKAESSASTAQASLAPREVPAPAPAAALARDRQETQAPPSFAVRRAAPSASRAGISPDVGAQMRRAAAAGRTEEVEALLAEGVPVDAADAEGETALMASVRSDHPATAALLTHHGASLDRTNRAGESARTMAAAKGDARLNQALDPPR